MSIVRHVDCAGMAVRPCARVKRVLRWGMVASVLLTSATITVAGTPSEELRNWFDDPFFQVSASVQGCPVPKGPLLTKGEMEREAHGRVERGTRCYLEGRCTKSNSYLYDQGIAADVKQALHSHPVLKGTSIWVTVQRRWVSLQGCVESDARKRILEAIVHRTPDVERVIVELGAKSRPRYAIAPIRTPS